MPLEPLLNIRTVSYDDLESKVISSRLHRYSTRFYHLMETNAQARMIYASAQCPVDLDTGRLSSESATIIEVVCSCDDDGAVAFLGAALSRTIKVAFFNEACSRLKQILDSLGSSCKGQMLVCRLELPLDTNATSSIPMKLYVSRSSGKSTILNGLFSEILNRNFLTDADLFASQAQLAKFVLDGVQNHWVDGLIEEVLNSVWDYCMRRKSEENYSFYSNLCSFFYPYASPVGSLIDHILQLIADKMHLDRQGVIWLKKQLEFDWSTYYYDRNASEAKRLGSEIRSCLQQLLIGFEMEDRPREKMSLLLREALHKVITLISREGPAFCANAKKRLLIGFLEDSYVGNCLFKEGEHNAERQVITWITNLLEWQSLLTAALDSVEDCMTDHGYSIFRWWNVEHALLDRLLGLIGDRFNMNQSQINCLMRRLQTRRIEYSRLWKLIDSIESEFPSRESMRSLVLEVLTSLISQIILSERSFSGRGRRSKRNRLMAFLITMNVCNFNLPILSMAGGRFTIVGNALMSCFNNDVKRHYHRNQFNLRLMPMPPKISKQWARAEWKFRRNATRTKMEDVSCSSDNLECCYERNRLRCCLLLANQREALISSGPKLGRRRPRVNERCVGYSTEKSSINSKELNDSQMYGNSIHS